VPLGVLPSLLPGRLAFMEGFSIFVFVGQPVATTDDGWLRRLRKGDKKGHIW
jgi:hypothetical protein